MPTHLEIYNGDHKFLDNEFTFSFLEDISKEHPELLENFIELKEAIYKFNSIGVKIDVSLKFTSSEVFK